MRYFRRLTLSQARWVGIDAAFVLALTGAALAGLGSTFTESEFWWIGMLGAFLAVLTTVVVVVMLRWPSAVAALVVVVWYFLLGPVLTLRSQGLAAPGPDSWRVLVDEALFGWKDLLTTLPPVDGESRLLALPWLLGLVTGLLAMVLSLVHTRRPLVAAPLPLLPPLALLALVILLGVGRPESLWLQGGVFAVLALAWLGLRYGRASTPVKSTQGQLVRIGTGAALVGRRRAAGPAGRHLGVRWRRGPGDPAQPGGPAVRRGAVPLAARVLPPLRRAAEGQDERAQPARRHPLHHRGSAGRRPRAPGGARPLRRSRVGSQQQRAARRRERHLPTRLQRDRQPGRGHRGGCAGDDRSRLERGLAADRGRPPEPAVPVGGPRGALGVVPLQPRDVLGRRPRRRAPRRRVHLHVGVAPRRAHARGGAVRQRRRGGRGGRLPGHAGGAVVGGRAPADAPRARDRPAPQVRGQVLRRRHREREDLPRRPQPLPPHRRHRGRELAVRGGQRRAVRRVDGAARQPDRRPGPRGVRGDRPRRAAR